VALPFGPGLLAFGAMRLDDLWFGRTLDARMARAALVPPSLAYGLVMRVRRRLYASGAAPSSAPALPAISIGNLTVGGTGKTPFAAWVAQRLAARARPAIVLRGYGEAEPLVHRRLNPGVPIVTDPDRLAAIRDARARGADLAILDDAFQHRRVRRTVDIVLVAVEQLRRPRHLLPAGPWREPLATARAADAIVLTHKGADPDQIAAAERLVAAEAAGPPVAVVHFTAGALADDAGAALPLDRMRGANVLAIAAIGEPELFARQLERHGARVALAAFRDHHRFTDEEVLRLARQVPPDGLAVCTLKDAVKLAGRWPVPGRLWYVSQHLVVEKGADILDGLFERALEARAHTAITAG